jgi:hypothetical protein
MRRDPGPDALRRSGGGRAWLAAAATAVVAGAGLLGLAGCDPRQALYFLQPFSPSIPAECASLKGKKVVILTTTVPGVSTDFLSLDREVSKQLTKILREKVKKIEVVDPSEVAEWMEAKPSWTDPVEAARAFEADVAISLEISEFEIQNPNSPGLYDGRSQIHVRAIELAHPKDDKGREQADQPKEAEEIYDKDVTTVFPVQGHMPVEAGVSPGVFRSTFLKRVVEELSWAFVDHSSGDDIQNTRIE